MAGEEDPRNKQSPSSPESSRQWHDDENPFVAFRRFADEQISSMMQSVMGLPSSATSPQSGHWAIFSDDQAYRDQVRQRQRQDQECNGDGNKTDEGVPSGSRITESSAQNDKYYPARSSRPRWYDLDNRFDVDMFFNSFFDRLWLDDHTTARLFGMYHHPLFSSMTSAESPMWPLNYLMFSPYSPLHLERQARYRARREQGVFSSLMSSMSLSSEAEPDNDEPRWREAFEDLLRLENGEPMLDRDTAAVARSEPRKDWLGGLIKRGSLGKQWKFSSPSETQPWSSIIFDPSERDSDEVPSVPAPEKTIPAAEESTTKPATELDIYDRFLADIDAREREFFGAHHSPLLHFLLADRRRGPNSPPSDYNDDTEGWLELVSGGNKHSVPESKSESVSTEAPVESSTVPTSTEITAEKPSAENYVVSNSVSTERVRLPDGSIQTKTVRTKRYADGREETSTSTEVVNPPQRDQNSGQQPDETKGGWFWRD
ncbi:uncharacterized protein DSM5745_00425 [Aspergillus mulundensis]|uniref:Uncharacterized protein n=1 Tax=Aspergillus mulundensis TaxID=1810919 RepID=A0A3D8T3I1_9EURO|nr:Uncharacterized protein DSM5745_00425 [Aspergillus mulundensis]RDW93103.1 Uncharacterized protein DSM5745_00425 [Aspergillus mulundensis]